MKTERGHRKRAAGHQPRRRAEKRLSSTAKTPLGGPVRRQLPQKDKGSAPSEERSSAEINRAAWAQACPPPHNSQPLPVAVSIEFKLP